MFAAVMDSASKPDSGAFGKLSSLGMLIGSKIDESAGCGANGVACGCEGCGCEDCPGPCGRCCGCALACCCSGLAAGPSLGAASGSGEVAVRSAAFSGLPDSRGISSLACSCGFSCGF